MLKTIIQSKTILFICAVTKALDDDTTERWKASDNDREIAIFKKLKIFLLNRAIALESRNPIVNRSSGSRSNINNIKDKRSWCQKAVASANAISKESLYPICKENYSLRSCNKFRNLMANQCSA